MSRLTHLNDSGAAHMVDISDKGATVREAVARGHITLSREALSAIRNATAKKGDVLATARLAGIMASKRTSELIPLCHSLSISGIEIEFSVDDSGITAQATAKTNSQTGVEMEVMTAVSVALLTIYDMVKSFSKAPIVGDIKLISKSGGKSGDWNRM